MNSVSAFSIPTSVFSDVEASVFSNSGSSTYVTTQFYKNLSEIVSQINNIMYEYSLGHFDIVAQLLTTDVYNSLAIRLNDIQQDANRFEDYENIRISTRRSLEGLYQSVLQNAALKNAEFNLDASIQRESILYDMEKLKEYIASLKGTTYIFRDTDITTIAAALKPEYAQYIEMYGFPEGGVFDTDRLAGILIRMAFYT